MGSAIEIAGVSKRFRLYHEKVSSLKERIIRFGRIPYEEFWALDRVDFKVLEGETMGLLGHNGSGKSTLLKCVAGILQPTRGEIVVAGRLAALLELGAGFHPELTGRENIFLNASILGMPRREIVKRLDDIVGFAELEQFIDNQVKHYSSGMYVRLGFAVAVNMEPDVLLVDEVLAVGDESFQRKCLDRVRQFQREGRTILFVTHAADQVRQICDRAAVLDHGQLVAVDRPGEAVRSFREHLLQRERYAEAAQVSALTGDSRDGDDARSHPERRRNLRVRITDVRLDHTASGQPYLLPGQPLDLRIFYEAADSVSDVVFGYAVHDQEGRLLFGSNTALLGVEVGSLSASGEIRFSFAGVPLLDGTYMVTVAAHSHDEAVVYDWHEQRYQFEVMNPGRDVGLVHVPLQVSLARS